MIDDDKQSKLWSTEILDIMSNEIESRDTNANEVTIDIFEMLANRTLIPPLRHVTYCKVPYDYGHLCLEKILDLNEIHYSRRT